MKSTEIEWNEMKWNVIKQKASELKKVGMK